MLILSCCAAWVLPTGWQPRLLAADPPAKPDANELSQWVMTYYQHPDPEHFVARVRQMSELKFLQGNRPEANEMFLGKIMAANPKQIAPWLGALSDLPPADAAVLHRAAWISQTAEAKGWLEARGQAELAKRSAPPLIAGGPMAFEPHHLDQLWEWFFATGDEKPVRKIVSFFHLAPSDPRPGELPDPPEDKNDRFAAANFRVAHPAIWSTVSLASQHDRVLEILKKLDGDPKLKPRSQAWLTQAIKLAEDQRAKRANK